MSSSIQVLSDQVANKIAAGEVVQRPSSIVKELLENAVDAESTQVQVIIRDAGKTLIQITDNGKGMNEEEALLCFERHATSKIKTADDLFHIYTKGFRGEALASIAAVSQVELITRPADQEMGFKVIIEGGNIKSSEPVACAPGTTFKVKNLFYNVPARRKFLKGDAVEIKHIIDDFQRVAFVHPSIELCLEHNGNELFNLEAGSFRQRCVAIMGKNYNQRLVPVTQESDLVSIDGFIVKPEFAKKTRGEQYFFVNDRFVKHPYLNHAIQNAYSELLAPGLNAAYFLRLTVDPTEVDVNIHPTKTEIKLEHEKAIYAMLASSVKQSLGQFNIAPSIDFSLDANLQVSSKPNKPIDLPGIAIDPTFNPFESKSNSGGGSNYTPSSSNSNIKKQDWEQLYAEFDGVRRKDNPSELRETPAVSTMIESRISHDDEPAEQKKLIYQLHKKYIFTHIRSGCMIIHQSRAHERVLFEQFLRQLNGDAGASQQLLFPVQIDVPAKTLQAFEEKEPTLKKLGFEARAFGKDTIIVHGVPVDGKENDAAQTLIEIVEQDWGDAEAEQQETLAASLARKCAIPPGRLLNHQEMENLIDQLFGCEMPYSSPLGKPTILTLSLEDLDSRFS